MQVADLTFPTPLVRCANQRISVHAYVLTPTLFQLLGVGYLCLTVSGTSIRSATIFESWSASESWNRYWQHHVASDPAAVEVRGAGFKTV